MIPLTRSLRSMRSERRLSIQNQIQAAIDRWFGRNIKLTDRVLQVLSEAPNHEDGWMDDAEVTTQILSVQPAVLDQCLRSGISEEVLRPALADMAGRVTRARSTEQGLELETTFQYAFRAGSKQFKAVEQRGALGTLDLFFGNLRSCGDDITPTTIPGPPVIPTKEEVAAFFSEQRHRAPTKKEVQLHSCSISAT